MKIGIDIRALTERYYSGISEYAYHLLHELFTLDSSNKYILFYNSAKKVRVPKFDYSHVSVQSFQYPNKMVNLSMAFFSFPHIDSLLGGVDLLFLPNHMFAAWSSKCRKIITIHDLSFEIYPEFFSPKDRLWLKLIHTKKLCGEADTIIAVSENTKRDLIDIYGIDGAKIKVIYEGVGQEYRKIQNRDELNRVREKYHLPKDFILYLGNLEPRKNISTLLTAFEMVQRQNKKIHLVLAGKEGWRYKRIVQENVYNIGYIHNKDKPYLYNLAKIFAYPSLYEGFGLPPLEAMACGTPTIASSTSSLPEVVGDAALLIDPHNSNDMAESLRELLDDPELAGYYSAKGQLRSKLYSWSKTAQKVYDIIMGLSL